MIRLLTRGTIEKKYELQQKKKELIDQVIHPSETIHAIYKQKEKSYSRLLLFDVQVITAIIQNLQQNPIYNIEPKLFNNRTHFWKKYRVAPENTMKP